MDTNERNEPEDGQPRRRLNSSIVAAGVAFGLTLAGLGVAAAQTDAGSDTSTTTAQSSDTTAAQSEDNGGTTAPSTTEDNSGGSTTPDAGAGEDKPARAPETELTGEVAEKVKAAALAAVPGGTIIRVETDNDGSPYEAHVRTAEGTEVVVKVNDAFEVTATEEGGGRHGGKRGPGGPGPGETALTGDVATKVTAAAQAAVPVGTFLRVETDNDGSPYEAHVRKADGTMVEVKVNESFEVTSVEEHTGGPGRRGPRPPAPAPGAEGETD